MDIYFINQQKTALITTLLSQICIFKCQNTLFKYAHNKDKSIQTSISLL